MIRIRCATVLSFTGAILFWIGSFGIAANVAHAAAEKTVRVAVAPFEGDSDALGIAEGLSARLATHPFERLIGPSAFVAQPHFEPPAAHVRQWAYNAAVDAVAVGRISPASALVQGAKGDEKSALRIEVILRSGHSGAEFARRTATLPRGAAGVARLDAFAQDLLLDLGFGAADSSDDSVASAAMRDPRSPEPPLLSGPKPVSAGANTGASESGILGEDFAFGQLREDVPIEIKADEAEIQDRGEDRMLFFQRNVRVRQGDVTLESDELEAEYRKGQSEPDRLVARGSVRVDQGHRRANCDRAIYLRLEQRLRCEGRAQLVQGCDVVRGESIEFDLASDQAQVRGAASIVIRPADDSNEGICKGAGEVL